jgi:hypothetical protein
MDSRFLSFSDGRPVVTAEGNGDRPRMWLGSSVQAAVGIYLPYLPEPRSSDSGRGSRSEVFGRHVAGFSRAFQRVLQLLSEPHVRRMTAAIERGIPFLTFDLRICGGGIPGSVSLSTQGYSEIAEPPRIVLLIKGVMETGLEDEAAASLRLLHSKLDEFASRFRSLAPSDLTTLPIEWVNEGPLAVIEPKSMQARIRPEGVGIGPGYNHTVEIRRSLAGSLGRRFSNIANYKEHSKNGASATVPLLWPPSSTDGLATCSALLAQRCATVLSLRVHPSRLTRVEANAMEKRLSALANSTSLDDRAARATLQSLLQQRDLFQCVVQISSESQNVASMVGQAFIAEHVLSGTRRSVSSDSRRLSAVHAVIPEEQVVAEYNLRNIEMLPWGFAWPEALDASQPAYNAPGEFELSRLDPTSNSVSRVGVIPQARIPSNDVQMLLNLPDYFLERDAEGVSSLSRMRSLFTVGELLSVWRLPVVPPGGYPGLQSRYPNPFEQLPEPTPANGDSISLGKVQSRGLDTATHFRVPFMPSGNQRKQAPGVAGVGDRSIVVAGSPGSGKTNFCLWFLSQLWATPDNDATSEKRERRTPYLVIDPTRGNEFRALIDRPSVEGSEDVVVFTVGDPRCSPFCFNPFQVPCRVSVQSHISRLMSCFRAAYEMWDPLPAIFEMALRRAYEGTRKQWWEERERLIVSKLRDACTKLAAGLTEDEVVSSLGVSEQTFKRWRRDYPESRIGGGARSWAASIDFAESDAEPFPQLADVVGAMGKGEKEKGDPHEMYKGMRTVMSEQKEMWGGGTENAHTIVASTYLRLRNLFENYDTIIGGPAPGRQCVDLRKLMEKPAILEFGMVGDSQALALIMSFLVCALAGTIEGRVIPESGERQIHMLVLEEAHRLLAGDHGGGKQGSNSKAQAAEDINTMLAEVRKYGQGVMIIDQRPGSLVGGVIDNAYLVAMHRLNEEKGFRQFVQQLNLNTDQQRYVRSELRPGQMVVLDRRSGTPVLVRPDNLNTDAAKMSDEELRDLMHNRVKRVLGDYKNIEPITSQTGDSQFQPDVVPASPVSALPSTQVTKRPYEDRFFNTLVEYAAATELELRKRHARNYLQDVEQYAGSFDNALAKESPNTRWLKVTQWFVDNRGLSIDIIESIKCDVE